MFSEVIISNSNEVFKFLRGLDLDIFLSKPQVKHIQGLIQTMIKETYNGKVSQANYRHRTSISRFLNDSSWDSFAVDQTLQNYTVECIWNRSIQTGFPIYVLIDDTTCIKTKPSSQVSRPIEGCSYHHSHLEHRMVYGHQFVTLMLRCDDLILPYEISLYEKQSMSKIELAKKMISSLPVPPNKGYILADSWYSCEALFEAAKSNNFYYMGALKTNRKIFPKGHRPKGIQLKAFAKTLNLKNLDLVTVEDDSYYTYTYLGKVKGGFKVKIILSWPEDSVLNPSTLRCFISHDINNSTKQILKHYKKRWPIETFFRETKQNFGLSNYQIRSLQGIKRLMLMIRLTYVYMTRVKQKENQTFGDALRQEQRKQKRATVLYIYEKAIQGIEINHIFNELKIA
ncbi:MAG: IS701 family transposase [Turicibacter sp.]